MTTLSERVAAAMGDCDGFGSVNFRDGRHVNYCSDCGQRDELGHDDECQWLLIRDLDAERLRLEDGNSKMALTIISMSKEIESLRAKLREAEVDAVAYRAINTPEIHDFIVAIEREALHQRERWASDHDAGKTDADWFWLIGYLAGKAINKPEKKLHHIITTAAACLNWHAHALGTRTAMRPGIGPDKQPPKPAIAAAKEGK